jgi:SiaC family regulatory phosphoprotein
MENIKLAATERTPEIDFDFGGGVLAIKNESYPEDVTEFYGPIIDQLRSWIETQSGAEITFNFELIYFNSSTAKVLMDLFDLLDEAAEKNKVTVNWVFEADDDNMEELGEEFGEDLEEAAFNMMPKE